jgi:hypothetical protein
VILESLERAAVFLAYVMQLLTVKDSLSS